MAGKTNYGKAQNMKLTICGARVQSGIGKDSQKPYEMARLFTLSPLKIGQFGGMQIAGAGFEPAEVECSAECAASLQGAKFPGLFEVEMVPRTMAGKTSFVVTSAKL